jgi:hypothetical protein
VQLRSLIFGVLLYFVLGVTGTKSARTSDCRHFNDDIPTYMYIIIGNLRHRVLLGRAISQNMCISFQVTMQAGSKPICKANGKTPCGSNGGSYRQNVCAGFCIYGQSDHVIGTDCVYRYRRTRARACIQVVPIVHTTSDHRRYVSSRQYVGTLAKVHATGSCFDVKSSPEQFHQILKENSLLHEGKLMSLQPSAQSFGTTI